MKSNNLVMNLPPITITARRSPPFLHHYTRFLSLHLPKPISSRQRLSDSPSILPIRRLSSHRTDPDFARGFAIGWSWRFRRPSPPRSHPATKRHGDPSERIKQRASHIGPCAVRLVSFIPDTSIVPSQVTEVCLVYSLESPVVALALCPLPTPKRLACPVRVLRHRPSPIRGR
ncbi:hypothetical protein N7478_007544 [Penicillium angulare]|uniref:uncharacterized protein n=1 Tax=Penicillium angulare TaxID=116970 RepID=UPI0025417FC4|nr:uncharacterized protein N7478_007544 [Penicillium angulare]KAJ5272419.1 hypothetical protein N7478_007544 [Penicillium angulare]